MIRPLAITCFISLVGPLWGADDLMFPGGSSQDQDSQKNNLPAVSLLPTGSTLKKVMLPRYNEKKQLLGVLRADLMRVVDPKTVHGTAVLIEMFRPENGNKRGQIVLKDALFQQETNLVRTELPVVVDADELHATGSGLVYSLKSGQGFLLGPVTTEFRIPPQPKSKP